MTALDGLAVQGGYDEPFDPDDLTHDLAGLLVLGGMFIACCAAWAVVIAGFIGAAKVARSVAAVIWG